MWIDNTLKKWTDRVEREMQKTRRDAKEDRGGSLPGSSEHKKEDAEAALEKEILERAAGSLKTPEGTCFLFYSDSTMGAAHSQNGFSSIFARAMNGPGTRSKERYCCQRGSNWERDCECCTSRYDSFTDPVAWGKPMVARWTGRASATSTVTG